MVVVSDGARSAPKAPRGLPLAAHLALFCAAIALPLLLLSASLLYEAARAERDRLETAAQAEARDVAHLLDRELAGLGAMLEVLASAPALQAGDLGAFDAQVRRLVRPDKLIIVLRDVNGPQLVNTNYPRGAVLPNSGNASGTDAAAAESGRPAVSDLFIYPTTGQPAFLLKLAVRVAGTPRYMLTASLPVEHLNRMLAEHRPAEGWWITLIDRAGTIIARTKEPERTVGTKALPAALEAVARAAPQSTAVMRSPEGVENFAAFHRVGTGGWTAAVAVPRPMLLAPFQRSLFWIVLLTGVAVAASVAAALVYGRVIARGVGALTRAALALGSGGKVPEVRSAIRDLSAAGQSLSVARRELAERAAEREILLRAAEAASTSKSAFLAAVSHDLRQPFQALRLFHALLERQAAPPMLPVVDKIGTALASGEELLAALVDISVIDAGQITVNLETFPLNDLLREVWEECQPAAHAAALPLRLVQTSAWVRSDRTQLRRMIRNLVANAIRYTQRGGIVMGCRRRGAMLTVEVVDTGIGISADAQDRIFDEFFQVGNDARDRRHGLGLGLAIVRRLSVLLDHPVTVSSRPGRGSVFRIAVAPAAPETVRGETAPRLARGQN